MRKELKPRKDGTPRKRKVVELTPGEVAFVKGLTAGKTLADAYRDAIGSGIDPNHSGWQALRTIKLKMPDLMDALGLTTHALIEDHLKPMLGATEVKVFKANATVVGQDEEGNEVLRDGGVIYSDPLVAWGPRKDALDMSFRLHGAYAPRPTEGDGVLNVTNNVQIINHIERPKRETRELGPAIN
jgi:hypothetical protein